MRKKLPLPINSKTLGGETHGSYNKSEKTAFFELVDLINNPHVVFKLKKEILYILVC
jgi:hypothetical protein